LLVLLLAREIVRISGLPALPAPTGATGYKIKGKNLSQANFNAKFQQQNIHNMIKPVN
jgi:hypothetical protein